MEIWRNAWNYAELCGNRWSSAQTYAKHIKMVRNNKKSCKHMRKRMKNNFNNPNILKILENVPKSAQTSIKFENACTLTRNVFKYAERFTNIKGVQVYANK